MKFLIMQLAPTSWLLSLHFPLRYRRRTYFWGGASTWTDSVTAHDMVIVITDRTKTLMCTQSHGEYVVFFLFTEFIFGRGKGFNFRAENSVHRPAKGWTLKSWVEAKCFFPETIRYPILALYFLECLLAIQWILIKDAQVFQRFFATDK
jgi:hypothetical protein